jgi:hypothetical protein
VATVLASDFAPARKRAVACPVGLRPLRRMSLKLPARPRTACGSVAWRSADRGLGGGSRGLSMPVALQRTCRISSLYAPINAYEGQAAITRPVTVGSATGTLAARLAALPTTSSAHGRIPPRPPSASRLAAWWRPRRSCHRPTAGSAPRLTPAARAAPPAGACAGRRPSPRSAPASQRTTSSST